MTNTQFETTDISDRINEKYPDVHITLTDDFIKRLCAYGSEEHFEAGDCLFSEGDTYIDMFVLVEGELCIYQHTGSKRNKIAALKPGSFTGDIANISGTASVAQALASVPSKVLRVPYEQVQKILVEDSELSDIIVKTFLARRQYLSAEGLSPIQLIGSRFSKDTFRIRDFLMKNNQPFSWIDPEKEKDIEIFLKTLDVQPSELPILIYKGETVCRNPEVSEMAEALGLKATEIEPEKMYDVTVVGAGPSGLAASVYAASEGLEVLTLDSKGPGGQAGTSSKIENYLGFPMGISGQDLANNAALQAQKFGVELSSTSNASKLYCAGDHYVVEDPNGTSINTRTVVIATGAEYRKLNLPNIEQYEGTGIYYGATPMEAQLCENQNVAIVGGGNSAGQAAVFLAQKSKEVYLMIRRESLVDTMSNYLIRRIEETPNIHFLPNTEVTELHGEGDRLQSITIKDNKTDEERPLDAAHLFLFIGAQPHTKWLKDEVILDEKGFVKTGDNLTEEDLTDHKWNRNREPSMFETSRPGIFAIGDVRSGSVKRVASAVGEGSICVSFIHKVLAA